MSTYRERRDRIASIEIALGHLSPNATPAEREAAIDAVLDAGDHEVEARSAELLYRLGAGGIYHPAAA
jgi:hypothetical protein